ncbi:hypothetical protein GGX14DRAFT_567107 [Mycena pura]|uniref:Uncharacterized protein n=1 Tax=Mycena pura TaxID=153505 RepID=A0AAD6VDT8_9AGAR|nr:hypothetical protein GGX14DRAFT_567107 [Mycena pura]
MTVGTACDVARGGFADVRSRQGTVYAVAVDAACVAAKRSACANAVAYVSFALERLAMCSCVTRQLLRRRPRCGCPLPSPPHGVLSVQNHFGIDGGWWGAQSARTSPVREAPLVIGTETGGVCGRRVDAAARCAVAVRRPRAMVERRARAYAATACTGAAADARRAVYADVGARGRTQQRQTQARKTHQPQRAVFANAGPSVLVQPSRQSARQKKCQYLYMELDGSMNG